MVSNLDKATNDAFLDWFKSKGGRVHSAVGTTLFPSMGLGAVALNDIKKETILFTLPRSLTLSTHTSSLPSKIGDQEWKKHQLHKGWVGLILCMLWEDAQGSSGKWSSYLNSIPSSFQTPMFWTEEELRELEGTTVYDKIGKSEAEKDYQEKLLPAVKSRPDLFPMESLDSQYSLEKYHIMGSRILSRSFYVEKWAKEGGEASVEEPHPTHAAHSSDAMDVDDAEPEHDEETPTEEEDSDEEDPSDVTMVPFADILNARYQSENAKLCYEQEELQMVSTRDIQAGDQIWNTYGDLPNSDLLRRYGHVDLLPIAGGLEGNPADIAEIQADLVVDVLRRQSDQKDRDFSERIEWWLEEGGDDIFIIETTFVLPEGLISLIRVLVQPTAEWGKTRDKGKMPKPKLVPEILHVAEAVLEKRLTMYRTSIEEDETILSAGNKMISNQRMAIIVRLGEKRILKGTLDAVRSKVSAEGKAKKKRRKGIEDTDEDDTKHSKKAKHQKKL